MSFLNSALLPGLVLLAGLPLLKKKLAMIRKMNPRWYDLSDGWYD